MAKPVRQIRKAAERWFDGQATSVAPAQLQDLLTRAEQHIRLVFGIDDRDARDITLAAWAEIEGRRSRCYVDLAMSTPHLIYLVDPVAKTRRPFPVVDLLRLLGPRRVDQVEATAGPGAA